jgi:hypothetical protein
MKHFAWFLQVINTICIACWKRSTFMSYTVFTKHRCPSVKHDSVLWDAERSANMQQRPETGLS